METQKSFANMKTACIPHASVSPECHSPMRVDVESCIPGERALLHIKIPKRPFYRARHQISLCHVFSQDIPWFLHEVHPLITGFSEEEK